MRTIERPWILALPPYATFGPALPRPRNFLVTTWTPKELDAPHISYRTPLIRGRFVINFGSSGHCPSISRNMEDPSAIRLCFGDKQKLNTIEKVFLAPVHAR